MYPAAVLLIAMSDNPTVELNGTTLEVVETDDGFEVREPEPDAGSVEKFMDELDTSEGASICVGSVDSIEQRGGDSLRLYVVDSGRDVVRELLRDAQDSPWVVEKVEFEYGYVEFRDTSA
jgi:hypothetical protein